MNQCQVSLYGCRRFRFALDRSSSGAEVSLLFSMEN